METTERYDQPTPGPDRTYPQLYYPQPEAGYASPQMVNYYQYPMPNQPQQQQQMFIMNGQPMEGAQPVYLIAAQPIVSLVGAIVLSCFVFWCCGIVFGAIAFILAMVGQSSAAAGDAAGAMQLRKASYGVSIAGIVVGIIIIVVVGGIAGAAVSRTSYNVCYGYNYNGDYIAYNC